MLRRYQPHRTSMVANEGRAVGPVKAVSREGDGQWLVGEDARTALSRA
jgi:hypothetical protein